MLIDERKEELAMKKLQKSGAIIANVAKTVTTMNVNSACMCFAHQPKLPETAKKLRKF